MIFPLAFFFIIFIIKKRLKSRFQKNVAGRLHRYQL
nr:MAG TPA: hypothetical protein [Caudoviricetes sp.]